MDSTTVVVPTVGRVDGLERLLGALAPEPQVPPWQVVVVDNAPTSRRADIAAAFAAAGVPGRVVREDRPGAAHARNRGVAEAEGAIVAFADDDVVPQAGWLAALVAPIRASRAEATGGPVRLDPTVALPQWLQPPLLGLLSRYERESHEHALEDDYVLTANAAVRRDWLARSGGFDPRFGPRPGAHLTNDDVALCRALRTAGARIRYVPGAAVIHDVPPERLRRRYVVGRCWWQGRSDWLLDGNELDARRSRAAIGLLTATGRELVANLRRARVDPGTPTRLACAAARGGGALAQWGRRP